VHSGAIRRTFLLGAPAFQQQVHLRVTTVRPEFRWPSLAEVETIEAAGKLLQTPTPIPPALVPTPLGLERQASILKQVLGQPGGQVGGVRGLGIHADIEGTLEVLALGQKDKACQRLGKPREPHSEIQAPLAGLQPPFEAFNALGAEKHPSPGNGRHPFRQAQGAHRIGNGAVQATLEPRLDTGAGQTQQLRIQGPGSLSPEGHGGEIQIGLSAEIQ